MRPLLALVVAFSATTPALCQSFTYQIDFVQQQPSASPAARYEHAMVYDATRDRTVLFGGYGNTGYLGDTWTWDGVDWQPQFVLGGPSPRYSHAMCFDSVRGVVVMFGGYLSGNVLGDTWEWDGTTWTQVATTGPSARYEHAMAFDAVRGVTVLHGGSNGGDQTWTWNGATWTQVPSSGPSVSGHALVFDELNQVVVLVRNDGDVDTWDGTNWTAVPTTGGTNFADDPAVYHAGRRRVIASSISPSNDQRFYQLSLPGAVWYELNEQLRPVRRHRAGLAYHASLGQMVLFGGNANSTNYNDTWTTEPIPAQASTFGTGCGTSPLDLQPVDPIAIGTSATAELTNAPSVVASAGVGFSRTSYAGFPLPVGMGGFGLTGCDLLISPDTLGYVMTPTTSGTLEMRLPVPNAPILTGMLVYAQAVCYAPGQNPAELILSNGIQWVIGDM